MNMKLESITQEYSQYIGEKNPDKVVKILTEISNHPSILSSHRTWEEYDRQWKSATKNGGSDTEIMTLAALTRESKLAKDHIHDAAATVAHDIAMGSGIIKEFTKPTLGEATPAGSTPELSVAWHNLRRTGIGGSSVSKVMGLHWKSQIGSPVYLEQDEYQDMLVDMSIEKMTPVEHADVPEKGVLYRGHMWEPVTLAWLSVHYNINVAISKDTWNGVNDYQVINVDGIIVDNEGNATGIVECKTSSREWTWEKGVPVNYRAQVLWYLNATGLDFAYVIVRFDTGRFEVFTIRADETIDGTSLTPRIDDSATTKAIAETWDAVEFYRENPEAIWEDSTTMSKEASRLGGIATSNHKLSSSAKEIVDGASVVHIEFSSPYERMDSRFTVPTVIEVGEDKYRWEEAEFPLYPLSDKPDDSLPTITGDRLCELMGDSIIVASNESTYMWLSTLLGGDDGIIDASAARRWIGYNPGKPDCRSTRDVLSWISTI